MTVRMSAAWGFVCVVLVSQTLHHTVARDADIALSLITSDVQLTHVSKAKRTK